MCVNDGEKYDGDDDDIPPKKINIARSKKRKIIDDICGGISNPPTCHYGIELMEGELKYKCPSRDGSSNHIITISNEYDKTKFTCDCAGGFNTRLSEHCLHIKSVLIYLCRQYVGNACEFINEKYDHIKFKHFMDSLAKDVDNLKM